MTLKMYLVKKNVSQVSLSRVLGLHPSSLSQFVTKGKMIPDYYIPRLCQFLGIDLYEFLRGEIVEVEEMAG